MEQITLKNNTQMELRDAKVSDAKTLVDFYNEVGGETGFLSFGKNEFPCDEKAEEKVIDGMIAQNTATMILALCQEEVAGVVTINSSLKRKMKHVGEIGICIRQKYCKLGLGTVLLQKAIDFARQNGVTEKISLIVRCDNEHAIQVYKKLGFETEGILKKESFDDGVYYDSICMGLFL